MVQGRAQMDLNYPGSSPKASSHHGEEEQEGVKCCELGINLEETELMKETPLSVGLV